jgi:hypothetical protein
MINVRTTAIIDTVAIMFDALSDSPLSTAVRSSIYN